MQGLPETVEDRLRDRAGAGMATRSYLFVVLEGERPLAGGARFSLEGVDEIHIGRGDERTATHRRAQGRPPPDALASFAVAVAPPRAAAARAPRLVPRGPRLAQRELPQRPARGARPGRRRRHPRARPRFITRARLRRTGRSTRARSRRRAISNASRSVFGRCSPRSRAVSAILRRLARATVGLLFIGETGTGKEVLARAIHEQSGAPDRSSRSTATR